MYTKGDSPPISPPLSSYSTSLLYVVINQTNVMNQFYEDDEQKIAAHAMHFSTLVDVIGKLLDSVSYSDDRRHKERKMYR